MIFVYHIIVYYCKITSATQLPVPIYVGTDKVLKGTLAPC